MNKKQLKLKFKGSKREYYTRISQELFNKIISEKCSLSLNTFFKRAIADQFLLSGVDVEKNEMFLEKKMLSYLSHEKKTNDKLTISGYLREILLNYFYQIELMRGY